MKAAAKHGIPRAQRIAWVRRKFGGHMVVWRERGDGTLGCCTPCVLCRIAILAHDMAVHVLTADATWYHGKLSSPSAPASKATSGQARSMGWLMGGAKAPPSVCDWRV